MNYHEILKHVQATYSIAIPQRAAETASLRVAWNTLLHDASFSEKLQRFYGAYRIPIWLEGHFATYPLIRAEHPYRVISSDGSQIAPDRHQVDGWYLLHSALVDFCYEAKKSTFEVDSKIVVGCAGNDDPLGTGSGVAVQRSVQEVRHAYEYALQHNAHEAVLLFDGIMSLVVASPDNFHGVIAQYITTLLDGLQQRLVVAWYTSIPASQELTTLLRLQAQVNKLEASYSLVNDTDVCSAVVPSGHRTSWFSWSAKPGDAVYPQEIMPYACYINNGVEIGRIEVPAYVLKNEVIMNKILAVIADQSVKGGGYPLALAEAHEAAVVTEQDRQFFYHALEHCAVQEKWGHMLTPSQKLQKKRLPLV